VEVTRTCFRVDSSSLRSCHKSCWKLFRTNNLLVFLTDFHSTINCHFNAFGSIYYRDGWVQSCTNSHTVLMCRKETFKQTNHHAEYGASWRGITESFSGDLISLSFCSGLLQKGFANYCSSVCDESDSSKWTGMAQSKDKYKYLYSYGRRFTTKHTDSYKPLALNWSWSSSVDLCSFISLLPCIILHDD
jgi:hypothetical protein